MLAAVVALLGAVVTAYYVAIIQLDGRGVGADESAYREAAAVYQAYDAARNYVETTPGVSGVLAESAYEDRYPPGYDGHGGSVTVRVISGSIYVYGNAVPTLSAVDVLGKATDCTPLGGVSRSTSDGLALDPACGDPTALTLPPAVPADRLVMVAVL